MTKTESTKEKKASSPGLSSTFTLQNTFDSIDLFNKELPTFNMKGKTHVSSYFGAFMSVLVSLIVIVYRLTKFNQLTSKQNPNVSAGLSKKQSPARQFYTKKRRDLT